MSSLLDNFQVPEEKAKPKTSRLDSFGAAEPSRGIDSNEPPVPYSSPGEEEGGSALSNFASRVTDPARWQAIAGGTGPAARKDLVAGAPSVALPAGQLPASMGKLAELLGKSAPTRIAANAASGAADGLLKNPGVDGSRLENAESGAGWGAGIAAGLEGMGAIGKLAGKGVRVLGQSLTRVSPEQAKTYAGNFKQAEHLRNMRQNTPDEFIAQAQGQIKAGIDGVQDNLTTPYKEAVAGKLVGKAARVNPSQFKGTAAGDQIERAHALHGKTATLEEILTPGGKQTVTGPAPLPEEVGLTGPQLLRAIQESGNAAKITKSANPIGYSAKGDPNARAAVQLKKALKNLSPEAADLNKEVSKSVRLMDKAKKMAPEKILEGNTTGVRGLREYFDKHAHTNMGQLADALQSAQVVHKQGSSIFDPALKATGRSALRGSGRINSTSEGLQDPALRQALLELIMKSGGEK